MLFQLMRELESFQSVTTAPTIEFPQMYCLPCGSVITWNLTTLKHTDTVVSAVEGMLRQSTLGGDRWLHAPCAGKAAKLAARAVNFLIAFLYSAVTLTCGRIHGDWHVLAPAGTWYCGDGGRPSLRVSSLLDDMGHTALV